MQRGTLFLLLSTFLLGGCAGPTAASSETSSSFSSSEEVLPATRTLLTGNMDTGVLVRMGERELNLDARFTGLSLDLINNSPAERVGDFLDPTYYDVADFYGTVHVDEIRLSEVQGHFYAGFVYEDVGMEFYIHGGTFYFSLPTDAFSDFGLETGKYYVENAFSALDSDDVATFGELLSSISLDMNLLLGAAEESEVLDEAITLTRVDDSVMRIRVGLSNLTLAHLVHYVSGAIGVEEAKASIDPVVTIGDASSFSVLYDAEGERLDATEMDVTLSPTIDDIVFGNVTLSGDDVDLSLSGTMRETPCRAFDLPSFDDYQPMEKITLPELTEPQEQ